MHKGDGMRGLRTLGGMAGVIVAVAGGIGAAVGLYSLPAPERAGVGAQAYAQAGQRAFTASTLRSDEFGYSFLRIEVFRGVQRSQAAASADTRDGTRMSANHAAGVHLHAEVFTCWYDNCDVERQWDAELPLASFQFSPLMDGASISGEAEGCVFDLTWHPDGEIVPFEGHFTGSDSGVTNAPFGASGRFFVGAFAEGSRTARADITMSPAAWDPGACDPYSRDGAPGYLTQGADIGHSGAGFGVE